MSKQWLILLRKLKTLPNSSKVKRFVAKIKSIAKLQTIILVERNWQREEKQGEKEFAPKEAESGC